MNKDLFDSMQTQMNPSPEVRKALAEKLALPAKRRIPVRKYVAVAACAALVIGGLSVYRLYQDQARWMLITQNFHRDALVGRRHSYVMVDGLDLSRDDSYAELSIEAGAEDTNSGGIIDQNSEAPSATESSPISGGGAQDDLFSISQDEAVRLYDILCGHLRSRYGLQENFSPNWPDWYGGGYLNNNRPDRVARLTIVLVKDYDTPALRQEIYDFLGSDHVDFQSGKYALSYLLVLQKKIMDYPIIREVFASSWTDEENNCLNLALTDVTDEILMALAELDPDDDAIYVQIGQMAAVYAGVEDDENLIADEPWVDDLDSAWYGLPERDQSVPAEEDPRDAVTYNPKTGEVTIHRYPYGESENLAGDVSGGTAAFDPDA